MTQLVKNPTANAGDLGSIPRSGRCSGEGNGKPLQYPCLENPMDREAWWATVHGVAKSWTQLSMSKTHLRKNEPELPEVQRGRREALGLGLGSAAHAGPCCPGPQCGALCCIQAPLPPCPEMPMGTSLSSAGAQGPEPAESRVQGSFPTRIPAAESVPETLQLPSPLQGHNQDAWPQKHQDTIPSHQEPWTVESTVINIPGGLDGELDVQHMPRMLVVMPSAQAPKSLPAIKGESGEEGIPVFREVGGCTSVKDPVPSSPTPVAMTTIPEDPEPGDRAPQLV